MRAPLHGRRAKPSPSRLTCVGSASAHSPSRFAGPPGKCAVMIDDPEGLQGPAEQRSEDCGTGGRELDGSWLESIQFAPRPYCENAGNTEGCLGIDVDGGRGLCGRASARAPSCVERMVERRARGRVGVWARATAHTRHPTPHTRAQYTNENELKTQIIHTHSFL